MHERVEGFVDSALMLILDVRTRWLSTHQMLRMAIPIAYGTALTLLGQVEWLTIVML